VEGGFSPENNHGFLRNLLSFGGVQAASFHERSDTGGEILEQPAKGAAVLLLGDGF
jgi:hypothetical protein